MLNYIVSILSTSGYYLLLSIPDVALLCAVIFALSYRQLTPEKRKLKTILLIACIACALVCVGSEIALSIHLGSVLLAPLVGLLILPFVVLVSLIIERARVPKYDVARRERLKTRIMLASILPVIEILFAIGVGILLTLVVMYM